MAVVQAGGYSGVPVDGKGECVSLPGFGHHLCMAWRQDNAGPHSAEEVQTLVTILPYSLDPKKTTTILFAPPVPIPTTPSCVVGGPCLLCNPYQSTAMLLNSIHML